MPDITPKRDLDWEDENFPTASEEFKRALRALRPAIIAFMDSDLGRLDRVIESPGPPMEL